MKACDFCELNITKKATLTVKNIRLDGQNTVFDVTADGFAHAVHFGLDDDVILSDSYFDLLAGETKTVTVYNKMLDSVIPRYIK